MLVNTFAIQLFVLASLAGVLLSLWIYKCNRNNTNGKIGALFLIAANIYALIENVVLIPNGFTHLYAMSTREWVADTIGFALCIAALWFLHKGRQSA